jgi:Ser/Thr protein kinase RdoA (MazF antagonist)
MPSSNDLAIKILQMYGLRAERLLPRAKGYRNNILPAILGDGRQVSVIIFKVEPGILNTVNRADAVAKHLIAAGLPARQRLDPRTVVIGQNRYAAIYDYLPGATISWEAYTQKHLKNLGKSMSDIHKALQNFDAKKLSDVEQVYAEILKRMQRYFSDPDVQRALAEKLNIEIDTKKFERYSQLMNICQKMPGRQALHMDFVRGNVLFDVDANVTGILDFEKTAAGHPLVDIARTMTFLLVDCKYKTPERTQKYFLFSGYQKRGGARLQSDKHLLQALMDVFLLYDFYKFLRHNPYESLSQNEHFTRTKDLMLIRRLLIPQLTQ